MGAVDVINDLANVYPPGSAAIGTESLAQPKGECQPSKATLRGEVDQDGPKLTRLLLRFLLGVQNLLQSVGPTKCRIQDERRNPTWDRVLVQPNRGRHDRT
jgi:hypothetical protein